MKIDGVNDTEIRATVYTLEAYEQQFKRDLIVDLTATAGTLPFTNVIRALWAMVKTADFKAGRDTLPYEEWLGTIDEVNYHELSGAVVEEAERGFFRPRAATAGNDKPGE